MRISTENMPRSFAPPDEDEIPLKILSINSEHTKGQHQIGLNLSKAPTRELVDAFRYMRHHYGFHGAILVFQRDKNDPVFDQNFVEAVQEFLTEAEAELERLKKEHKENLIKVSQWTGLPHD